MFMEMEGSPTCSATTPKKRPFIGNRACGKKFVLDFNIQGLDLVDGLGVVDVHTLRYQLTS